MKLIQITLLLLCFLPGMGNAVEAFGSTPSEAAMCKVKMRDYDPSLVSNPKDVGHMHHYCDCLRFANRALRYPSSDPRFKHNIRESIDGCNYVIKHVSPSFYMLPSVYVARGRAYLLAKEGGKAAGDFMKALALDKNFVPAYIGLIKFYQKIDNKEEALKIAIEGLKLNPNSRPLKRRYLRLGGKEPFPGANVAQ